MFITLSWEEQDKTVWAWVKHQSGTQTTVPMFKIIKETFYPVQRFGSLILDIELDFFKGFLIAVTQNITSIIFLKWI